MKKLSVNFLVIAAFSLLLLAFVTIKDGGIKGKVSPDSGAVQVVAVAGTDTIKGDLSSGSFTINNVKPGTYTVWVKAKPPYKDKSVENVAVVDSTVTDVGEIKLEQ
ncbi:carboxypeptidase regulatory-like domain-containing protein [Pedobacter panaciterrae]|jgi:hypothetical protein|uniref:Carboxypeptidase regulatory-like domain-containing protein n=1 Tax=Pedobacter panaciterrae TaxID=363849 RepID=A0ABU8NUB6_9SPHI|nr:carboxypeptidase regulatory-like domain-containing protein [Pedobacter panaciterrae]NQX52209.1 carboxypeptidase regulatory-like domain-containing protein [Pedobacter panaciterrae]